MVTFFYKFIKNSQRTKKIRTSIFFKSLYMDILVYYNKKDTRYHRLLSEDVVKSFTVGVDEKNESMNNVDVMLNGP